MIIVESGFFGGLSLLSCLFYFLIFSGMPLRQQGVPRTSGAKTKQGELFVGRNPLIAL